MFNKKILKYILILISFYFSTAEIKAQLVLNEFDASSYVGSYKIDTQNITAVGEIRFENSALIFTTDGIPLVKLVQEPEIDKFKADKYEVVLLFVRNEFKEVIAAKIWFQGQEFYAKKI